jgi:hypothetical protein
MKKTKGKQFSQLEKERDNNSQTEINKLNNEYKKALESIIDKTENENTALKKIIKAFNKTK